MMYNQLGDYTAPQEREEIVTVLDGIRKAVSPSTKVNYVKGCAIRDVTASNIPAAVDAARSADVVVLVVGGSSARDFKTKYIGTGAADVSNDGNQILSDMDCGEGYDRSTLRLLGDQEKLLEAVAATGKPLVVVYIQGRTLNMNLASEKRRHCLRLGIPVNRVVRLLLMYYLVITTPPDVCRYPFPVAKASYLCSIRRVNNVLMWKKREHLFMPLVMV